MYIMQVGLIIQFLEVYLLGRVSELTYYQILFFE